MYKGLIIGCGNIGAMYDWNNEQVLTHAKAYSKTEEIKVDFFDLNNIHTSMVAKRYNGDVIFDLDKALENNFYDLISICTPTSTHFNILSKALKKKVPVIICEKPISTNKGEIGLLTKLYNTSESKVIVNYFRSFQPSFLKLKNIIATILKSDEITNISIRYQRGFINNCSHAFDLLQFLFHKEFNPINFIINRKDFDHFDNDPTITGNGEWLNANINILGLQNVKYPNFEIDLYFTKSKILIQNAGNEIIFLSNVNEKSKYTPLIIQNELSMQNCVSDYMIPVVKKAMNLLNNKESDNFIESLKLNEIILNILNK
jgi:predicted dehydrogenase